MGMNWKFFIARRIYRSSDGGKEVSKPAIRIAGAGIAVGLAVMVVAVAVAVGFKRQVRDKVAGLGADVWVTSLEQAQSYQVTPVAVGDSLLDAVRRLPGVGHVQRYSTKPGMMMTADNFLGMVLKGVGQEYDLSYLRRHLVEGELPQWTDSVASRQVVISRSMARRLHLKVGDDLLTYYLEGNVRARKLQVAGIYETHFAMFDELFLLTDLYSVNRLNGWSPDEAAGLEVRVVEEVAAESAADRLRECLDKVSAQEAGSYYVRTVDEVYPQLFAWLDLLDLNVWVILILMTGVAGFTMISGLLILILERTRMIGLLKALGADNTAIRHIFLTFSVFLIGRGMLWGNVVGIGVCLLQRCFELIRLDPATYYVDAVPIELDLLWLLLLNVATLVVSVLMLLGPSCLVGSIHPARSMQYE